MTPEPIRAPAAPVAVRPPPILAPELPESPEPLRHFQAREAKRPMKQISTAAVIDAMRLMVSAPAASAV